MIVRSVTPQDKHKIHQLIEQRGTFNAKEIQVAMELVEDALNHPEKSDYHVFCALDSSDRLVGYICFGPVPMTDGCYDLYWIAVDEKFSRTGIGGRLLDRMEEFMIMRNARRIYVETSSTEPYNAARTFYARHGYGVVSVLEDFYRKGDDKIILMKEL